MKHLLVWALAILNLLTAVVRFGGSIRAGTGDGDPFSLFVGFLVITFAFSIMGAIIVARTGGNLIGWLMLGLGFVLADPFATYLVFNPAGQTRPTAVIYFALWTQGWFFFVVIYLLFLIILHFPTGRPPGPRWKWVMVISLAALGQFILAYTFQPRYGDESLQIDNPISLLPVSASETFSGVIFGLGLIILAGTSLASVVVRFRREEAVERAQIKWLLFAGAFAIVSILYRLLTYKPQVSNWTDYLLIIALAMIAVAISIAILRYRLYDIDIILRRTVQYALLTGILVTLYYGAVIVLQRILDSLTGNANSPLVTVISTLVIAALFNPLRTRIQGFIDRRFFRRKYDAEKALTDFSETARDDVDMVRLSGALLFVVETTLQPEQASLWLREAAREN